MAFHSGKPRKGAHLIKTDKKKAENLLFLMKWIKKSALIYKEEKNNNRHS